MSINCFTSKSNKCICFLLKLCIIVEAGFFNMEDDTICNFAEHSGEVIPWTPKVSPTSPVHIFSTNITSHCPMLQYLSENKSGVFHAYICSMRVVIVGVNVCSLLLNLGPYSTIDSIPNRSVRLFG